ncbi:MAG: hypothetical protein Q7L55_04855 [Actinomycetota bacterium]|nr:hypothetical protein [Actinomycetota bacterium]
MSDPRDANIQEPEVPEQRGRNRRDIWQLHIPLAFGLLLCSVLTVVEVRRATDGVWRAWVYSFQWPLIGAVCIWIWYRYWKEGSLTESFAAKWRRRIAGLEAESIAADHETGTTMSTPAQLDPQLEQWQEYLRALHRSDPPGQAPQD